MGYLSEIKKNKKRNKNDECEKHDECDASNDIQISRTRQRTAKESYLGRKSITQGLASRKKCKLIYICEKHFLKSDLITNTSDVSEKKTVHVLSRNRSNKDAILYLWPDSPSHLSKISSPRPTTYFSSEPRRENVAMFKEMEETAGTLRDIFHSLDELDEKVPQFLPSKVTKIKTAEYIIFLKFNLTEAPKIMYSIKITADLQILFLKI